jgi:di/tricarboxylate transporter
VLALAATRVLTPAEAFRGFAHPAVVLVASMYVFAAAVSRTGVTELIGARLVGGGKPRESWLVFRIMLVAGVLSSVLSNAAVVATLIPVLEMVARRAAIPRSRILMPLAYGSLIGGLCSVLGTSKNIAVNEMVGQLGYTPFGLFEYSLYGLVLLGLGSLYFLGPGRMLLPRRREPQTLSEHYHVPQFITEVLIEPNSTLINRAVGEPDLFDRYGVTLLGMVRAQGEASVLAPGPYNRIRPDDVLILQGEPEAILRMRREMNLSERASVQVGATRLAAADVQLVEAVVPAGSTLVGSTLAQAEFRQTTGCNVLAISKHGDVQPTRTADMPLDVGDTLLLQAHAKDVARLRERRILIVLDEVAGAKFGAGGWATLGWLAFVLACGVTKALPLSVAALLGACGLVLFKLVRPDEVRRTVDWSVLLLIGGMLSLGLAFEKHGLDDRLAGWLTALGDQGLSPRAALAVVLLSAMGLTQLMTHVAAAVIMTPVALSLALELGVSERPLVMAVLTGASSAFMSPVAHQANAMVMGPGEYRYRDFVRAGAPLTVLLLVAAWLLLPVFFPF